MFQFIPLFHNEMLRETGLRSCIPGNPPVDREHIIENSVFSVDIDTNAAAEGSSRVMLNYLLEKNISIQMYTSKGKPNYSATILQALKCVFRIL